jgi:GDP-L-fucose synthase
MPILDLEQKIYVAGHRGLVGSALVRALHADGAQNLLLRTSAQLDLCNQDAVMRFFRKERPDFVFLAAAKVGGILANSSQPADFIQQNLAIQSNVIHASYTFGVKRLLFLGSSCIYPKLADIPITEDALMTGRLEPTNEPYAVAKIAGLTMCAAYNKQYGTDFITAMPTNLYGPNDRYHPHDSHVLVALLHRMIEAKRHNHAEFVVWGTGTPRREFLHVDDLAKACLMLMKHPTPPQIANIGFGSDISINELAALMAHIVGYTGKLVNDTTKPDGTPRKLLDSSRIRNIGWAPTTSLEDGITNLVAAMHES